MSVEVYLSAWLRPDHERDYAGALGAALRAVEAMNAPDDDAIFNAVRVTGKDTSTVRLDLRVETSRAEDVLAAVRPHLDDTAATIVDAVWDVIEHDDERSKAPLTVQHYAAEHGLKRHAVRSFGSLRVDFFTTKSFRVRRNFDWPLGIARLLIRDLDPLHLMIYTDLEVHPLTAHALYHRDVADFAGDLQEIARLCDHGGAYRAETAPGHPSHRSAWTTDFDYGTYRRDEGDPYLDAFRRRVAPLLELGRTGAAAALTREEIGEALAGLTETHVERIRDGLLLYANDAPFAYLEEPFIHLQHVAAGARQS